MYRPRLFLFFVALATSLLVQPLAAHDLVDAFNMIRDEGFHRSQVEETTWHLTEGIGPRMTGSPQLKQANEWARDQLAKWGLKAWLEGWDFGHGWTLEECHVRMITPYPQPLQAVPMAWTPATGGTVRGRVVRARLESEDDLEEQRGKLAGAIVLLGEPRQPALEREMFDRWDADELVELGKLAIPQEPGRTWRDDEREKLLFWPKLADFLVSEGVVATVKGSILDNGAVWVAVGGSRGDDDLPKGVPDLVLAIEQYNRLHRFLDREVEVELELTVAVTFHHDDPQAYNTLGELPGSDLADEVVMAGGHLDSWHAATGTTDNGSNCAVIMEALRIIKATGLKPRRTIRIGLWGGEEQFFRGSKAYVARHLATRPLPADEGRPKIPVALRQPTWPVTPLPDHARFSVYFNLDHGSGRVRGVYTMENVAVKPLFTAWLEPLHDIGADTVLTRFSGGTDHLSFDEVGLPGFPLIQDPGDSGTRTHHSNLDTYDHISRDDLVQSSVVLATLLWQAANHDHLLSRKPLPTAPAK